VYWMHVDAIKHGLNLVYAVERTNAGVYYYVHGFGAAIIVCTVWGFPGNAIRVVAIKNDGPQELRWIGRWIAVSGNKWQTDFVVSSLPGTSGGGSSADQLTQPIVNDHG